MGSTKPIPVNLAQLIRPYMGEWVALSRDEKAVLGHGATIDTAIEQAKRRGEPRPLLIKVPDKNSTFLL